MLPILIYEPDSDLRLTLLDSLDAKNGVNSSKIRVSLSTGSSEIMKRGIEAERGISLMLLGIVEGQVRLCMDFGDRLMRQNRNSYVVYCLHSPDLLDQLLERCMRPAGIITGPWPPQRLSDCINRILEDYESQFDLEMNKETLTIEANNKSYRVPYDQITYLEALDKMITLHTYRQTITVRHSLSTLADMLPEQFVRCHRAYVVNSFCIEKADFSQMILTLSNGEILPISRSQRSAIRQAIDGQKGDAHER